LACSASPREPNGRPDEVGQLAIRAALRRANITVKRHPTTQPRSLQKRHHIHPEWLGVRLEPLINQLEARDTRGLLIESMLCCIYSL